MVRTGCLSSNGETKAQEGVLAQGSGEEPRMRGGPPLG